MEYPKGTEVEQIAEDAFKHLSEMKNCKFVMIMSGEMDDSEDVIKSFYCGPRSQILGMAELFKQELILEHNHPDNEIA